MRATRLVTAALFACTALAGTAVCKDGGSGEAGRDGTGKEPTLDGTFVLSSPAFGNGERVPRKYTCEGDDVSPPLTWTGAPKGTKGFVLTCYDPDAPGGGWVHWGVYDIPAGAKSLDEGRMPAGAGTVANDFKKPGWGGPCPPRGHGVHHYVFTLYAVPFSKMEPPPGDYASLEAAAKSGALGKAVLTGTYER